MAAVDEYKIEGAEVCKGWQSMMRKANGKG